ncbi:hypothetical protein OXPF_33630 [Oxobacter pfennigii]|uniref:Uncharacterized protein n=1 Tax=Oxobacter pfennigii TaxID=36849 RepID=A0A0P8WXN4_9CLOT|nr:hypothetical protein [Oxobacter pfennigii]KPU43113.1 hypothetical protein OXPF_33630 [Oxobacter pfennigii]
MSEAITNKDVKVKKAVRYDTKALVGAVILGVVFVFVQQIAHRIDAVINPASVIVGGVTWAIFTGLVVLLFKQPAGIITSEIQAFVALASGLSPLAPFFIPANGLASLAYSLVSWKLSMDKWSHHIIAQVLSNVVGNICVGLGLYVILRLPIPVIIISSLITTLAGIVGGTIFTKIIYDNVKKSGVLN